MHTAPDSTDARTLEHEQIANEAKHWVRLTAACNSRCVFCLDAEAQDGRILAWEDVCREIRRGREEKGATRIVLSGGEASIHPRFHDFVAYSKAQGYRWIQTVTNGRMFAKREFYQRAVAAGLAEITFSLHGHDAPLHDRLTRAPGSFDQLVKAMLRAARDGRVIVNADVVINKQNVMHLEKIVALCAQIGVREFDLLHVIPQGEAFDHRDELFYDPAEHAESLRRVFRLAKNPAFHIWTNRFPLAHLEGVEELIQDPHKMLDEVGGRRMQFRRYLDAGEAIDCRHPARCPHCFIEPFCASLDRRVRALRAGAEAATAGAAGTAGAEAGAERIDVFRLDRALPEGSGALVEAWRAGGLPGGARRIAGEIPAGWAGPRVAEGALSAAELAGLPPGSRWRVEGVEALEALWAAGAGSAGPGGAGSAGQAGASNLPEIEIVLDREAAAWLLERAGGLSGGPSRVAALAGRLGGRLVLAGGQWGTMGETARRAPDFRAFFEAAAESGAGVLRARGLPACLCPGAAIAEEARELRSSQLHEDGRLAIDAEVERYTREEYRAKSLRCRSCPLDGRCAGAHIQLLRHRGFVILQPVGPEHAQIAGGRALLPGPGQGAPLESPAPRWPVPGLPVPEIDVLPGRRS